MKTTVCKITFHDEMLRNDKMTIAANFGDFNFSENSVTVSRTGFNKELLDIAQCINDINGGFSHNRTWIEIPSYKLDAVIIEHDADLV